MSKVKRYKLKEDKILYDNFKKIDLKKDQLYDILIINEEVSKLFHCFGWWAIPTNWIDKE